MIAYVEVRVCFPGRMAEIEWRNHDALAIPRYQRQPRIDIFNAFLKRNYTVEDRYASNVKRRFFRFEIKENRVLGGKAIPGIGLWHGSASLLHEELPHVACRCGRRRHATYPSEECQLIHKNWLSARALAVLPDSPWRERPDELPGFGAWSLRPAALSAPSRSSGHPGAPSQPAWCLEPA